MVKILAGAFPGRAVHGVGDAAFHGRPLVIEGTTWTTRLPSSAVLYGPKPPRTGKRGRPRVKGDRLGTPAQHGARGGPAPPGSHLAARHAARHVPSPAAPRYRRLENSPSPPESSA